MIRTLLVASLVAAVPRLASADVAACDADRAKMAAAMKDPALSPPTEDKALADFTDGNKHHREGLRLARVVATRDKAAAEFQLAIDAYAKAAGISTAPSIMFNIAQSYRAAGDYDDAITQYQLFLKDGNPGQALRDVVACLISTMTAEKEKAAASAPPRDTAPEPKADAAAPAGDAAHAQPPIDLKLHEQPPPPEAPPWQDDGIAWGLTGTGAVAAAIGVYLLADAHDLELQANGEPRDDVRAALRAQASTRQTWGTITTVAGGALLVGGIVKLIRNPAPAASTNATSARASFSFSPSGFVVEGRF
jgi:tetratricopeptide (TPR) repeat protein